ncbi:MAG: hypothetical protein DSY70_04880 [Desulfobulbus sp.]|nr:MAG: hypothetical protein DSY70_04880 [Desulfobulbus sp.]
MKISVAIPSYQREQVLLDTIEQVLALDTLPLEILVVDQTPIHGQNVEEGLQALAAEERIHWLRLKKPSIPAAMNRALLVAQGEVVLFLDDDVELVSEIVSAHVAAHQKNKVALVAGQVIQNWQTVLDEDDPWYDVNPEDSPDAFRFNSCRPSTIFRFMGGNFSVNTEVALKLGGFDENFVKVAYNFEAEFADRLLAAGHTILFYPKASIRHLKTESGGTRSFGDHLTTLSPSHAVGRYYYQLAAKNKGRVEKYLHIISGPFRAISTRFHLLHPWWIPVTFVAECSGIVWALSLHARGPRLLEMRS